MKIFISKSDGFVPHHEGCIQQAQLAIDHDQLQEELQAQRAIAEKTKKVETTVEVKINRLRDELRQSMVREENIQMIAKKDVKGLKAQYNKLHKVHEKLLEDFEVQGTTLGEAKEEINVQRETPQKQK